MPLYVTFPVNGWRLVRCSLWVGFVLALLGWLTGIWVLGAFAG